MYLVDANILVYAVDESSPKHAACRDWLDGALDGPARTVGLAWPNLLAFLRLTTNHRIFSRPLDAIQAWDVIEHWLSRPAAWIPVPGPRHFAHMERQVRSAAPTGNAVPDAHLAALASEHALTVVSADQGFAKFADLAWLDPTRSG